MRGRLHFWWQHWVAETGLRVASIIRAVVEPASHLDDALPLDVRAVALALQRERRHEALDLWALAVRLAVLLLRLRQGTHAAGSLVHGTDLESCGFTGTRLK